MRSCISDRMAAAPIQPAFGTMLLRWVLSVLPVIVGLLMVERSDYRQDASGGKRVPVPCRRRLFIRFATVVCYLNMRIKMRAVLSLLMLGLAACANPFVQFYQDRTDGTDLTKSSVVVLPTGEPKMFQGADKETDYQRMLENGYNLVGFSSFNGADVNVDGALAQAKAVHSEIVLIYSKHTDTRSGVLPLTLPDTQTSTTTLSGSGFGSGGYRSFSGTANTTTYGTQTTYIPYSVDRYDYFASY